MQRYWLNLKTLHIHENDMEFGRARQDAARWLGKDDLGWFSSVQERNNYVIAALLPVLEAAWRSNPYSRLGQLVSNATGGDHDPYYVPDGEMLQSLRKMIK